MAEESGLDRRPRAEGVRLLAAACYLPGVAPILLAQRRHREIRLLHFHACAAIGLQGLTLLGVTAAVAVSALLGELPGADLGLNMLVGLGIVLLLCMGCWLSFAGAWAGYAGTYTRVPLLADWAWQRVNHGAPARPTRRRRRRPEGPPGEGEANAAEGRAGLEPQA